MRTGWAPALGQARDAFVGHDSGVPGRMPKAAWLAAHRPRFVGSDTTAFEHIPAGEGHARLPVHKIMLVENGMPIIEMLNLETARRLRRPVFDFVISPLPLIGATGSPVRPLALLIPLPRRTDDY